jgi:hypothetical protein
MNIFITGGSGFIGSELVRYLTSQGHRLTLLSRATSPPGLTNINWVRGNPSQPGPWQNEMAKHEAVINLAGSSIFCRWNKNNRQNIYDSRILTTRNIANALARPPHRVQVLLNGSAVGFYGNPGETEVDETSGPGQGFLAEICTAWEKEASRAERSGVRVVRCRLGVILGRDGGALEKMLPVFRAGFGARLGSGRQWFPWLHLRDLVRIFNRILVDQDFSGPINCVAPELVTNAVLTRTLAQALQKKQILPPAPSLVLKLVQGEASALLLNSLKVRPAVLLEAGFNYDFPTLSAALNDLVRPAS